LSKALSDLGARASRTVSELTSIDRALDKLRGPTTVQERLGVLQELVQFWHGPIGPGDGIADGEVVGIAMPQPLRWWYRWAGKRDEILSGQNILREPRELEVEDGLLCFYLENQGVYEWGTLPDGDDPPVFGRYSDANPWEGRQDNSLPWKPENLRLSEHLILACLFEAVFCHAEYSASAAWLDERTLAEISKTIPPIAIGPWGWFDSQISSPGGARSCWHARTAGPRAGRTIPCGSAPRAGRRFNFSGRIWTSAGTR
jgi:hypothetical protein